MRIAMWSGPRNLSTAMMYSFAQRSDFAVWDEPFYAAYLARTGVSHPMREEVLAAYETDADKIAEACLWTIPDKKPHFYMKHMAHHMVEGFDLGWARDCENVFLIRHPARVVASYAAKRENPTLEDIGFRRQSEILEILFAWGCAPVVIDSFDIRRNPRRALRSLCRSLNLPFDEAMLNWPACPRPYDGVWAAHWYGAVHKSTGFADPEGNLPVLTGAMADLVRQAMPYYDNLHRKRLGSRH